METPQEGIKKLQEEITCPICLEDFADPKRLPCGHICCKACLQGLLLRSMDSAVTCPVCRSVTHVPDNDLDNLPSAFLINRSKEVYRDLSKGICHPCPKHPSQSRDLYCEICRELICQDCIVLSHQHQQRKERKYSFVKDVAAEQKETVLKKLVPVERLAQQATESLAKIEEVKREVIDRKEDLIQEITESFDALHHVLEEQKKVLLVGLHKQTDLKLATIEVQQQEIEAASNRLQQVLKSACAVIEHNDGGHEFLSKEHQLIKEITEVTTSSSQVNFDPVVASDLVARVLHPAELKKVCTSADYVQKGVPDIRRCSAVGDGLNGADMNISTFFVVNVVNEHRVACSGEVRVQLKTLRDGAIINAQVITCSPLHYKVSYTPTVRFIPISSIPILSIPILSISFRQLPLCQLPTSSIPTLSTLTKWELTKREVDKVGNYISKVD